MINKLLKTATLKQSAVTLTGTIINGALGTLFYILVARILGPADFGLIIVAITSLTLIADIADFGTNTGLVKFVSGKINSNRQDALEILKVSLIIKLIVWLFILVLGISLSSVIASEIFGKKELTSYLTLSMIGVGGALLFSYATSALQAFQKFFTWSIVNIITNFLRLILVGFLLVAATTSTANVLIVYIAMPFLGFLIASFVLPTKEVLAANLKFPRYMFRFNLAVAIFTIFAAISARLDTFITASLLSAHDTGIYGAANQLTSSIPQLVSALGVVVAPKFASFDSKEKMLTYLKKLQLLVTSLAILGLLIIPISYLAIPLIYGTDYLETITPFIILLIGMLVFLISIPIHNSIFYYYGKPEVFIWVAIGHLLVIGVGGFYLINLLGVSGAALTVLIGMVFNFIAPLVWFLWKIKRE